MANSPCNYGDRCEVTRGIHPSIHPSRWRCHGWTQTCLVGRVKDGDVEVLPGLISVQTCSRGPQPRPVPLCTHTDATSRQQSEAGFTHPTGLSSVFATSVEPTSLTGTPLKPSTPLLWFPVTTLDPTHRPQQGPWEPRGPQGRPAFVESCLLWLNKKTAKNRLLLLQQILILLLWLYIFNMY